MFTSIIVYLYYLYRTYVLYYCNIIIYKLTDKKKYYIVVVHDNDICVQFDLDEYTYSLYNSRVYKTFIVIKHNVYNNNKIYNYYQIIVNKYDTYQEFMTMEKSISISDYCFLGAEIKNKHHQYAIHMDEFALENNVLFFREFNIWLLKYYFNDPDTNNISVMFINNIMDIHVIKDNECLFVLKNNYYIDKTI